MAVSINLGGRWQQKEDEIRALKERIERQDELLAESHEKLLEAQDDKKTIEERWKETNEKFTKLETEVMKNEQEVATLLDINVNLEKNCKHYQKKCKEQDQMILELQGKLDSIEFKSKALSDFSSDVEGELRRCEKAKELIEKEAEGLRDVLGQKQKNITLLEKSVEQKDRHIAVLLKEKEKLFKQVYNKPSSSSGLGGDEEHKHGGRGGVRPLVSTRFEPTLNTDKHIPTMNYKTTSLNDCSNKENEGGGAASGGDQNRFEIMQMKKKLKKAKEVEDQAREQIEKLKAENSRLLTRLRNARK